MITVKAIKLTRDKSNRVIYYTLEYPNGDIKDISVRQLAMAMWMGEIRVTNLKLTKDGKVIRKNRNDFTHEIKRERDKFGYRIKDNEKK